MNREEFLGNSNPSDDSPIGPTCGICLEETQSHNSCRLLCGHVYHDMCICKWTIRKAECPVCRASIRGCNHSRNQNDSIPTTQWDFLLSHNKSILMECFRDLIGENSDLQAQLDVARTDLQLHLESPTFTLSIFIPPNSVVSTNRSES